MATAPIQFLRECFEYQESTGHLIWKFRPRHHFKTDRSFNNTNVQFAGKRAGSIVDGYLIVRMGSFGYARAHRIAYAIKSGEWPDVIDHINGNRHDNRWTNLRLCNKAQNCKNRRINCNNRSGYKGVSAQRGSTRWCARIQHDGKEFHIGMFDTPKEAHAAYVEYAKKLHGEFANAG